MAGITAYTGLMGSGKSYEVVANVIVPALCEGRRVVTNVAGLQLDAIKDYAESLGFDVEKLGQLVTVDNEAVGEEGFFPVDASSNEFLKSVGVVKRSYDFVGPPKPATVRGGDLVVLDEVWRWYATGCKLPAMHMEFLRMHRHYTNSETGRTCDVVLIVQQIDDLQRKVRGVVEKTFVMTKHKALGLHKRYVVAIYGGNRISKASLISTSQHQYDKRIFALYQSHSQSKAANAIEKDADSRGSLFSGLFFRVAIPAGLLFICAAFFVGYRFFHPSSVPASASVTSSSSVAPVSASTPAAIPLKPSGPAMSSRWRVVGHYVSSGSLRVVISDASGLRRLIVDPPSYKLSPAGVELALPDGDFVTSWTGPIVQSAPGLPR